MTETGVLRRTSSEACGRSKKQCIWDPEFSKTGPKFSKTGPKFSKTGTKFSKTWLILSYFQSNGRVSLNILYKPSRDPEYGLCSYTPRFSYRCPETCVPRCAPCTGSVASAVYGSGYGHGDGYSGWVYGWVIPGYTQPARFARKESPRQRSGPRNPLQGGGVGGLGLGCVRLLEPTLRARSLRLPGSRTLLGQYPASWPIRARFDVIS